jgi:hypothetical protein
MRDAANHETKAHYSVADYHYSRVNRVPRKGCHVLTTGTHHRQNERCLDGSYGYGQDQSAERLAHTVSNDFGMMDCCDDGTYQRSTAQNRERYSQTCQRRSNERCE